MAMLQSDKVVFYHPCNDNTEFTQTQDWAETTPVYSAGKVSNGLAPMGGDSIDSFGAETEFRTGSVGYISAATLSATQFVVAYQDNADSSHGTAKVGTVSGADIHHIRRGDGVQ